MTIIPAPRPAGPLLRLALSQARHRFERECRDIVLAAMEEGGLPDGTRFDSDQMIWILPTTQL